MDFVTSTPNVVLNWKAAQTEMEKVIRSHSKTFFWATALLPAKKRVAIRSLYAFCRKTDDLVDRHGASMKDLEDWREQVGRESSHQTDPVLLLWSKIRQQYRVNRRYERELIAGVGMDLQQLAYSTWQELEVYCYYVASTVGLLSIPIIGLAPGVTFEQAMPYAIRLGIALQLTNILRDVGEDAHLGRIYLPDEDLRRFGLTRQDIVMKVLDDRFVRLLQFEIARARRLYRQALPGIALLSRSARFAVTAAALLYQAILDEIEAMAYNVYQYRAHTTAGKKVRMLPGILYTTLTLRPPAEFSFPR